MLLKSKCNSLAALLCVLACTACLPAKADQPIAPPEGSPPISPPDSNSSKKDAPPIAAPDSTPGFAPPDAAEIQEEEQKRKLLEQQKAKQQAAAPVVPVQKQVDDPEKARKYRAQLHAFDAQKMAQRKEFRGAALEYKQAVQFEPENLQYQLGYANAAHESNDWANAVEAYRGILKIDPSHTDLHKTIAECLFKLRRYDEACDEYKKAVQYEKDKADCWRRIAEIRVGQGRHTEAMDAYRAAMKAGPADGTACRQLASMLWNAGNKAEALQTYREGIRTAGSKDGDLQAAYAYALMSNQQWKEAADAYKEAARLKGSTPEINAGYQSALQHIQYDEEMAKREAAKKAKHKK